TQRADAFVRTGMYPQAEKDLNSVEEMLKQPKERNLEFYLLLSRINLYLNENKFDLAERDLDRLPASLQNISSGRLFIIGNLFGFPMSIKDAYSSINQICKGLKPRSKE